MATEERDRYEFRHQTLVELRTELELKQASMAKLLGVPQNTLSRWETGATPPDAKNLAKFYGIAMERKITPEFFRRRRPMAKKTTERTRLLVFWDFQNAGRAANRIQGVSDGIRTTLQKVFVGTSYQSFKAFAGVNQAAATENLIKAGWRVWEDDIDMDEELISQLRSDCGQEPQETVLVLIAKDRGYSEAIQNLKEQDIDVYLGDLDGNLGTQLKRAAGEGHVINLRSA